MATEKDEKKTISFRGKKQAEAEKKAAAEIPTEVIEKEEKPKEEKPKKTTTKKTTAKRATTTKKTTAKKTEDKKAEDTTETKATKTKSTKAKSTTTKTTATKKKTTTKSTKKKAEDDTKIVEDPKEVEKVTNEPEVKEVDEESKVEVKEDNKDKTPESTVNPDTIDDNGERYLPMSSPGDKNCFIYFSMNITGNSLDADIISIALVDSNNRTFYAEFTDYDVTKCGVEEFENCIKKLKNVDNVLEGDNWTIKGDTRSIGVAFSKWIKEFTENKLCMQFVGDRAYLQFLLLIKFINMGSSKLVIPPAISPALVDINQEIGAGLLIQIRQSDNYFDFIKGYIPTMFATTYDRTEYLKANGIEPLMTVEKGYPLYDAMIIKQIHHDMYPFDTVPQFMF